MIGPINSILGADSEEIICHFLTKMPWKYKVAKDNNCLFNACFFEIKNKKIIKLTKIEKNVKIY